MDRVKLKHLMTVYADRATVESNMRTIAEIVSKSPHFTGFDVSDFRTLPPENDELPLHEYINRILDRLFDFADAHRIRID